MEHLDQLTALIALTLGAGWASGINLYAAILTLGVLQSTGNADLPAGLEICADPLVMAAAGLMYCVEFFADKTPGVDTGWDALHTFIRLPAGAALAAAAVADVGVAAQVAAALVGGSLAAGSHALKAGGRVMINTSPEPVSNWSASFVEDLAVIGGLWVSLNHPWVFLAGLGVFLVLLAWLLPRLWRGIRRLGGVIARAFGRRAPAPATGGATARRETGPPTLPPPQGG